MKLLFIKTIVFLSKINFNETSKDRNNSRGL